MGEAQEELIASAAGYLGSSNASLPFPRRRRFSLRPIASHVSN
jgi:hypothetical protein